MFFKQDVSEIVSKYDADKKALQENFVEKLSRLKSAAFVAIGKIENARKELAVYQQSEEEKLNEINVALDGVK